MFFERARSNLSGSAVASDTNRLRCFSPSISTVDKKSYTSFGTDYPDDMLYKRSSCKLKGNGFLHCLIKSNNVSKFLLQCAIVDFFKSFVISSLFRILQKSSKLDVKLVCNEWVIAHFCRAPNVFVILKIPDDLEAASALIVCSKVKSMGILETVVQ